MRPPVKRFQKPSETGLVQLVSFRNNIPMEEALMKAGVAGTIIVPNRGLGTVLLGESWKGIRDALPCWTGTLAAYDKPGAPLGKTIEYVDYRTNVRYVFLVPEEHIGKKDVLFISEHPNFFFIRDGNSRIVQAREMSAVEGFGVIKGAYREEGWYLTDPIFDLPVRAKSSSADPYARYFWRAEKMISLISRGYGTFDFDGRRVIDLFHSPSDTRGVVTFAPGSEELFDNLRVVNQVKEKRPTRIEQGKGLEELEFVLEKDAELLAIIKSAPRRNPAAFRELLKAMREGI